MVSPRWNECLDLATWYARCPELSGFAILDRFDDRSPRWIRDPEVLSRVSESILQAAFEPGHLNTLEVRSIAFEFSGGEIYPADLAYVSSEKQHYLLFAKEFAPVDDTLATAVL